MNNKYFSTSVPLHSPELWWKHSSRWSRSAQSLSGPPWTDGSSMPRKSDKSHRDPGSRKVKAGGEKWFEALKAKLDMLADMCVRYRSVLNGGFFHFDNTKRILCFNWRGKKGGQSFLWRLGDNYSRDQESQFWWKSTIIKKMVIKELHRT